MTACKNCGKAIRGVNWYNGPGWAHDNGGSRCGHLHAAPEVPAEDAPARPSEPASVTDQRVQSATIAWYDADPQLSWDLAGKFERVAALARTRAILEADLRAGGPA